MDRTPDECLSWDADENLEADYLPALKLPHPAWGNLTVPTSGGDDDGQHEQHTQETS